jgi:hypothetical protein
MGVMISIICINIFLWRLLLCNLLAIRGNILQIRLSLWSRLQLRFELILWFWQIAWTFFCGFKNARWLTKMKWIVTDYLNLMTRRTKLWTSIWIEIIRNLSSSEWYCFRWFVMVSLLLVRQHELLNDINAFNCVKISNVCWFPTNKRSFDCWKNSRHCSGKLNHDNSKTSTSWFLSNLVFFRIHFCET